jgi:hypothetical protein
MAPDEDAHTHTDNGHRGHCPTLECHHQAPSRDEVITQRQLRRSVGATTKISKKAPVLTDRVTRSKAQVNVSELIHNALASTTIDGDPRSYEEAMLSPLKKQWQAAIMEESNSIIQNETFSPVNLQELRTDFGARPIRSKWVFKTKRNPDGSTRYKARLVIKGYKQMDYGETYAPVGKLTTFRLLMIIAARNNWNIDHLDVVTAFLNPDVDDDALIMKLPEGWPHIVGLDDYPEGEDSEVRVVRLRKPLYCLKQAPHLW